MAFESPPPPLTQDMPNVVVIDKLEIVKEPDGTDFVAGLSQVVAAPPFCVPSQEQPPAVVQSVTFQLIVTLPPGAIGWPLLEALRVIVGGLPPLSVQALFTQTLLAAVQSASTLQTTHVFPPVLHNQPFWEPAQLPQVTEPPQVSGIVPHS